MLLVEQLSKGTGKIMMTGKTMLKLKLILRMATMHVCKMEQPNMEARKMTKTSKR